MESMSGCWESNGIPLTSSSDQYYVMVVGGTPALVAQLPGHTNRVNKVILVPNDTALITVSDDRTIRVWIKRSSGEYWPSICQTLEWCVSALALDNFHLFVGLESGNVNPLSLYLSPNLSLSLSLPLDDRTIRVWIKRSSGEYWPSICQTLEWCVSALALDNFHLFVGLESGNVNLLYVFLLYLSLSLSFFLSLYNILLSFLMKACCCMPVCPSYVMPVHFSLYLSISLSITLYLSLSLFSSDYLSTDTITIRKYPLFRGANILILFLIKSIIMMFISALQANRGSQPNNAVTGSKRCIILIQNCLKNRSITGAKLYLKRERFYSRFKFVAFFSCHPLCLR
eukprot:sb/3466424/